MSALADLTVRCLGCGVVDVPPPNSFCIDCAAQRRCKDCGGPKGHGRLWARCIECQRNATRRAGERLRAVASHAGIDGDELLAEIRRRAAHPTDRSESDGE